MSIEAERCFFIRLGKSGEWTEQCISAGQLRLDYPEVSHEFCLVGRWTQVESQVAPQSRDREGAARHTNQIRAFYEASATTLWITFHADCMWWCFANPRVTLLADGTKVRTAIDGWRHTDMSNERLTASRLSGGLLAIQAYRGTICAVDPSYVLQRTRAAAAPGEARERIRTAEAESQYRLDRQNCEALAEESRAPCMAAAEERLNAR